MCLIQDCIEGKGTPAGLADVFFQRYRTCRLPSSKAQLTYTNSGPIGTEEFSHRWHFDKYIPSVMVSIVKM